MDRAELEALARRWIDGDPDPDTRAELARLLEAGDYDELEQRFALPLEFGTAGLRGIVGGGPARMNRAVVIRTTSAIARWLLDRVPDARALPVVLGWDGRLSSFAFAEDAAGVLAAAGIAVRYFDKPVPTPVVAFAARELGACAGIVITASHNPPEYNGYKVYGPEAMQISAPVDREIAERIVLVGAASEIRRLSGALSGASSRVTPLPAAMLDRYLGEIDRLRPPGAADRDFEIVYTPLHGVGAELAVRALEHAGFRRVRVVPAQAEPDGRFPSVRFPNPEEPGALDLALDLAAERAAPLILANDPDADRLAACVGSPAGGLLQLTGNQLGILLADFVLEHTPSAPRPLVVATVVSSPMIAAVAQHYGARFELTLTGFKWIWLAARRLEQAEGVRFAFGYEEALGYAAGRLVRDKDGISAALLFAELVAQGRARGESVLDRLQRLYRSHGLWVSTQLSIVRAGSSGRTDIERATALAADAPPAEIAGRRVERVRDFRKGGASRALWLGETLLVELDLEGGGRILVRPSGTEPKLKIYVDLRAELREDEVVSEREQAAQAEARALAASLAAALGLG
jgi:phosphomannomutase